MTTKRLRAHKTLDGPSDVYLQDGPMDIFGRLKFKDTWHTKLGFTADYTMQVPTS